MFCSLNMLSVVSLCSKLKLVLPSWIKYIRIILSLVRLLYESSVKMTKAESALSTKRLPKANTTIAMCLLTVRKGCGSPIRSE